MKRIATILLVLVLAACSGVPRHDAAPLGAAGASSGPEAVLTRYHWQLRSAVDTAGKRIDALFARAGRPLTLDFTDRALVVSNTCNRMRGGYALALGRMDVGNLASTLMACSDPLLTALDHAAAKYLHGSLLIRLDVAAARVTLTLTTAANDRLVFDGVPTPETRFGSKGTTEFLEVAANTRACADVRRSGAQCLDVRELHYDAAGLRAGTPGPWRVLAQPIEGFTHEPGVRNVLRVTRYVVANPPAGSPPVTYVLDMVVESEASATR